MELERDPAKSEATFRVRGFDFAYASRILPGGQIETPDARLDYSEARIKATCQDWEQNRSVMEPAAQTLLKLVDREPEAALRASREPYAA